MVMPRAYMAMASQNGLAARAVAMVGTFGRLAQVMAQFGAKSPFDQGLLEGHRRRVHDLIAE